MKGGLLVCMMCLAGVVPAGAQGASDRPVRRLEVTIGAGTLGGAKLESEDANIRANDTTFRPYQLFRVTSLFGSTPFVETRTSVAMSRRWSLEGVFVFSHPELRSSISRDVEGASPRTIVERVDQYFVEGSLVLMLDELRLGSRTVPFVAGGAGYLRQLHEGHTVIEEGHLYHLGGGIKHWMLARERGVIRAAGVRADGNVYLLAGGIAFQSRSRPQAAISGGFFVSFY
jgi:hypothetical protein